MSYISSAVTYSISSGSSRQPEVQKAIHCKQRISQSHFALQFVSYWLTCLESHARP